MNSIIILMELCYIQSEKIAIQLGLAIKSSEEEHRKLLLLEEYRKEHIEQFQLKLSQGLNVGVFDNFKKFISSLEQLILNQKHIADSRLISIEICRKDWQDSEKKRLTYTTLINRSEASLRLKEHKLEQKQTDEFASRKKINKY